MAVEKVTVFWFRRDLRLEDNAGFYEALKGEFPVLPVFIFDREILDDLPEKDPRVTFIFNTIQKMRKDLQDKAGSSIATYYGKPIEVFKQLVREYDVQQLIANRDYEPYALKRDENIHYFLSKEGIPFSTYKDQVIFEKNEVVKEDGEPYRVYTPYMKKWKEHFKSHKPEIYSTGSLLKNCIENSRLPNLTLSDMGFSTSAIKVPYYDLSKNLIRDYEETRDYPAINGTSRLSPHLRFGTVSVRQALEKATDVKNKTFWNELIWREFFMQILYHFPETRERSFKKKYDRINWRNNEEEFEKWKTGTTGFPLVDAGMRQLNESGWMHNRVRMVVGSFLCKYLLIDWRWGEAYFAEKLLDYEMSSNVGNWQWVAGCGADAAPYFRIFNPASQLEKYDKDEDYVKEWIKEYNSPEYPEPMVSHKDARERCLKVYKEAVG